MGWADSAADGATGGSGGYGGGADRGSDRSTKSSGYTGGFGAQVDTGGARSGSGSTSRASTRSSAGSSSSQRTSQASTSGYDTGFARDVAATPTQGISSGSIASMDEAADLAEQSFVDRTSLRTYADTPRGYNPSANISRAESVVETIAGETGRKARDVGSMVGQDDFGSMVDGNLDAAYGGVQQASQPHGVLSTVQNVASGLLGPAGMAVDLAVDSYTGGKQAASTLGTLNDQYDTTFDTSVANSIGKQAAANTLGVITSMGLSRFGANAGLSLAGVNGARVGGLLGNAAGGQVRDMAVSDPGAGQQVANTTTESGSAPPRGLLSSAVNQPATTTPTSNGFADFDGYASYAESFFA